MILRPPLNPTIWLSASLDNQNAGTTTITNRGSAGTVTMAGGMGAGTWTDDTTHEGVRCWALTRGSGNRIDVSGHGISGAEWWAAGWVYITSNVMPPHYILRSSTSLFLGIGEVSGTNQLIIYNGASWVSYSTTPFAINTWNHWAIQTSATNRSKAWINGVPMPSITFGGTIAAGVDLQIGGRSDNNSVSLGGRLDDVMIGSGFVGGDAIAWLAQRRAQHSVTGGFAT